MLVDPIQHHGVPHQAIFLFEHPVVFVRKGQEAGWNFPFLEDVEGGESFATQGERDISALCIMYDIRQIRKFATDLIGKR